MAEIKTVEISDTPNESIYDLLRAAIFNGDLQPGDKLVEKTIAEQYGVSRTPIREAMLNLKNDGFLEQNGRHLQVRVTTLQEVMEIYDCRIVLEATAAKWAARSRTQNDLIILEVAHEQIIQSKGATPLRLVEVNRQFHEAVWRASQNDTLVELLNRLEIKTRLSPQPTVSQPGRWDDVIAEHLEIIEAIRERDDERAYSLTQTHMKAAQEIKLRMMSQGYLHN